LKDEKDCVILAGDIGGTKANMLLSHYSKEGLKQLKKIVMQVKTFIHLAIFSNTSFKGSSSQIKSVLL